MIVTTRASGQHRKGSVVKIEGTGDTDGMYTVKEVEPIEGGLEEMVMQKIGPSTYPWWKRAWYTVLKWFRRGPFYVPPFTKFVFPIITKPFPNLNLDEFGIQPEIRKIGEDYKLMSVSLVSEDQLVDKNCRIFYTVDANGKKIK